MSGEIIAIIGTAIAGAISSTITWFLGRRKYNSDVDNTNIQNMKESLEFYIKISDDYKSRLATEIDSHNAEVAELKKENAELKRELREQERRFDERLLAQQREIAQMKNQMLSVYSQVCLNLNCTERVIAKAVTEPKQTKSKKHETNVEKTIQKA